MTMTRTRKEPTGLPRASGTSSPSRSAFSERPAGQHRQDGRSVGAEHEEADLAEIDEAGDAVLEIEAEAENAPDAGDRDEIDGELDHPRAPRRPRGRQSSVAIRRAKAIADL